jgi:hypothetical protein
MFVRFQPLQMKVIENRRFNCGVVLVSNFVAIFLTTNGC